MAFALDQSARVGRGGFAAQLALSGSIAVAAAGLLGASPAFADAEAQASQVQNALIAEADHCRFTGACNGNGATPAAAEQPDVWGAIALSPSTLASGNAWNYRSAAEAASRATAECRKSGASDCKVVVTVADHCVALAISKAENIYTVGGPVGAANYADGGALLRCQRAGGKNCTIDLSFCADGIRHVVAEPNTAAFSRRR